MDLNMYLFEKRYVLQWYIYLPPSIYNLPPTIFQNSIFASTKAIILMTNSNNQSKSNHVYLFKFISSIIIEILVRIIIISSSNNNKNHIAKMVPKITSNHDNCYTNKNSNTHNSSLLNIEANLIIIKYILSTISSILQ
jgi:hypothetical protein